MKKSFFGYNAQEVDETLECLEASNTKLEKQVRQIRSELENVRAERDQAAAEVAARPNKERELKELSEQCAQLKMENERLRANANALAQQIEQIGTSQDELAQTSEICRAAYQDMSEAKMRTRERIEEFSDQFLDKWAGYRQRVADISQEMKTIEETSREAFLSAADEILEKYAAVAEEGRNLSKYMDEMGDEQAYIHTEVEKILSSLEFEKAEKSEPVPSAQADLQYAVLRALKDRSKGKETSSSSHIVLTEDKKVAKISPRDLAPRQTKEDEIGISIGVNTRNIVND